MPPDPAAPRIETYDVTAIARHLIILKICYFALIFLGLLMGLSQFLQIVRALAAHADLARTPWLSYIVVSACGAYALYVFPHVLGGRRLVIDLLMLCVAFAAAYSLMMYFNTRAAQLDAGAGLAAIVPGADRSQILAQELAAIVQEVFYFFLCAFIVAAFAILIRLAFDRVGGRWVMSVIGQAQSARAGLPRGAKGRAIDTPLAILCLIAALLLWLLAQFFLPFLGLIGLMIAIFVSLAICVLLLRGRQYLQPSAQSVLDHDHRAPILFLRSFVDDAAATSASVGIGPFGFARLLDFSLETRLASYLMAIGPFIAVGSPQDRLPPLGAPRMKLRDDNWHLFVERMIAESQLIVMLVGTTEWITWEFKTVLQAQATGKLLLLFPRPPLVPPVHGDLVKRRTMERYEHLKTALGETRWEKTFGSIEHPERLIGVTLSNDGSLVAVESRVGTNDAFDIATEFLYLRMKSRAAAENGARAA